MSTCFTCLYKVIRSYYRRKFIEKEREEKEREDKQLIDDVYKKWQPNWKNYGQ